MRRFALPIFLLAFVALPVFAGTPHVHVTVDLQKRDTPIPLTLYELNTEQVRFHVQENETNWVMRTNDNWRPLFAYWLPERTAVHTVTGVVNNSTNTLDFSFATTNLSRAGRFEAQLRLTNSSYKIVWNDIDLTVKKSTMSGSTTPLALRTPVNWDDVEMYGDPPWVAFTNGMITNVSYWASTTNWAGASTNWLRIAFNTNYINPTTFTAETNTLATDLDAAWTADILTATNVIWIRTTNLFTTGTNALWIATTDLVTTATNVIWTSTTNAATNYAKLNAYNAFAQSNRFAGVTYHANSVLPTASNSYDLGSAAFPWNDIYIGTSSYYVGGVKFASYSAGKVALENVVDGDSQYDAANYGQVTNALTNLWIDVTNWTETTMAYLQDGDTLTTGLYGPAGTASNQYVNRAQMYDLFEGLSVKTLFGATNTHGTITWAGSLLEESPSSSYYMSTVCADGTNYVGMFLWTNAVDFIRDGDYIGRFYAYKSAGTKTVNAMIQLVYLNSDGSTTNTIDPSGVSGAIGTSLTSYRLTTHNEDAVTQTNSWIGVAYYLVQSGGGANATIRTYLGEPYDTHLETPGIGAVGGYVTESELTIVTNTLAGDLWADTTNLVYGVSNTLNSAIGVLTTGKASQVHFVNVSNDLDTAEGNISVLTTGRASQVHYLATSGTVSILSTNYAKLNVHNKFLAASNTFANPIYVNEIYGTNGQGHIDLQNSQIETYVAGSGNFASITYGNGIPELFALPGGLLWVTDGLATQGQQIVNFYAMTNVTTALSNELDGAEAWISSVSNDLDTAEGNIAVMTTGKTYQVDFLNLSNVLTRTTYRESTSNYFGRTGECYYAIFKTNYSSAEADTLQTVVNRGNTSTNLGSVTALTASRLTATRFGYNAGNGATLAKTDTGYYNGSAFFGYNAGPDSISDGSHYFGRNVGYAAKVTNTTVIGLYAGRRATGTNHVFIDSYANDPGYSAGASTNDAFWLHNGYLCLGRGGFGSYPDVGGQLRGHWSVRDKISVGATSYGSNDVWYGNGGGLTNITVALGAGSVSNLHMTANSVNGTNVTDGAIASADLAGGAVTAGKVAAAAVGRTNLNATVGMLYTTSVSRVIYNPHDVQATADPSPLFDFPKGAWPNGATVTRAWLKASTNLAYSLMLKEYDSVNDSSPETVGTVALTSTYTNSTAVGTGGVIAADSMIWGDWPTNIRTWVIVTLEVVKP